MTIICKRIAVRRINLSFGEKLRSLREDKDLNQTQLGEMIHMTQRKISYLECGKYEPSMEDIVSVCLFFHISADSFLGMEPGLSYPDEH